MIESSEVTHVNIQGFAPCRHVVFYVLYCSSPKTLHTIRFYKPALVLYWIAAGTHAEWKPNLTVDAGRRSLCKITTLSAIACTNAKEGRALWTGGHNVWSLPCRNYPELTGARGLLACKKARTCSRMPRCTYPGTLAW